MKNKRAIILSLIGLFIILGGVYFQDTVRLVGGGGAGKAVAGDDYMLVIDYGGGDIRKFKGDVEVKPVKAWDLLQQASVSGVSVKTEKDFVPRSIDGVANQGDKKWILYINNFKQNKGPFEAYVQKEDTITFKYE